MVVVVANDLPPAVRGRMKLWFVEPKANIFVSGIKDSVADSVVDYLMDSCPFDSGLLVFKRINKAPGFKIYSKGLTDKAIDQISGYQLIIEKYLEESDS